MSTYRNSAIGKRHARVSVRSERHEEDLATAKPAPSKKSEPTGAAAAAVAGMDEVRNHKINEMQLNTGQLMSAGFDGTPPDLSESVTSIAVDGATNKPTNVDLRTRSVMSHPTLQLQESLYLIDARLCTDVRSCLKNRSAPP